MNVGQRYLLAFSSLPLWCFHLRNDLFLLQINRKCEPREGCTAVSASSISVWSKLCLFLVFFFFYQQVTLPESKPAWINWCLGSAVMLIKCLRLASKLFYWYYDKVCSFLILGLDQMWVLYVAKFFCLLLGSQVGGEHGCSTVLWLRRVWNPWRHKKSLLKIQPIPWAISWLSLTYFPTGIWHTLLD